MRDDVDDAAGGIGAVSGSGCRATQHVDAFNVLDGNVVETRRCLAASTERNRLQLTVRTDAVDEQQSVIGLGAANAHLRLAAARA